MKTISRYIALSALAACLAVLPPKLASAQIVEFLPVWTSAASSCAPDEGAIGKYAFTNADFLFNGSAVSDVGVIGPLPITVRCNVTNPLDVGNPDWNALIVGFQDPDGKGTAARASFRLLKVSRPTGAISVLAPFDSNLDATTTRHERFVQFAHTFDYQKYEYMVEISLTRANSTLATPRAYSVRLTDMVEVN